MATKDRLPLSLLFFLSLASSSLSSTNTGPIHRGFTATPDPSLQFQPLLTDPSSTFSFGFLRINSTLLDLAILHLPSSLPLWRAVPNTPASWSSSTSLSFNGTLLLSDPETGLSWSTATSSAAGDSLILLNSSNLQITTSDEDARSKILWQSFDFPSDTIVQDQNFTSSAALLSSNQRFSMRLGPTYLAFYMEEAGGARPMYWKRTSLQAKAAIVPGHGPLYARIDSSGYLGVYQNESAPVDVMAFDTFNGGIKKSHRRLTLEGDGNVRAYYWSGSAWVSDFVAISDACDLPTVCGPYGMCHVEGQRCGWCVDNRTDDGCFPAGTGDLCGSGGSGFRVVRRAGVDVANRELLGFRKVNSLAECEGSCENNCSCWGAVYNNASGYCYRMDYPIQTLLAVGDDRRVGYFKVRNADEGDEKDQRRRAAVVLTIVGSLVLACGCGFAGYRVWSRRKWSSSSGDDEMGMPYKDLNSSSFRSIELANSFRK